LRVNSAFHGAVASARRNALLFGSDPASQRQMRSGVGAEGLHGCAGSHLVPGRRAAVAGNWTRQRRVLSHESDSMVQAPRLPAAEAFAPRSMTQPAISIVSGRWAIVMRVVGSPRIASLTCLSLHSSRYRVLLAGSQRTMVVLHQASIGLRQRRVRLRERPAANRYRTHRGPVSPR